MTASANPSELSVDLILATLGRVSEVGELLRSLASQSHQRLRVIVVDQNADDRLVTVLARHRDDLSILRIRSAAGLSSARNAGLRHLQGDVVAFADDDCSYPPDLLGRVVALLSRHPEWDGLSGRVVDEIGRSSSARWASRPGPINRFNVWTRGASAAIFLRRRVVERVGAFDETLGLGSGTPYGSGEETDYLIRALDSGLVLRYDPSLTVFHPDNRRNFTATTIAAGYSYGAGMGRVLRMHYPWWFALYHCLRALGGVVVALGRGRIPAARFHWAVARGRLRGWSRLAASPTTARGAGGRFQ